MGSMSHEAARDAFELRLKDWNWAGQKAARQHILEAFLELAIANGFNSVPGSIDG